MTEGPCLVTGHTGFIGAALMRALAERGRRAEGLADSEGRPVDLRDAAEVAAAVARVKPRTIFHLGGVSGPMYHADDSATVLRVNVEGAQMLLDAAAREGVARVVVAGSVAGYAVPGPFGPEPDTLYGLTKRVAELQARLWSRRTGREATAVRIGSVYGAGRQSENPIHRMVEEALAQRRVTYVAHRMEPCIEIRSCAALLAGLAGAPVLVPRYDAVTEHPQAAEVARIVCELTGAQACPQPGAWDGPDYAEAFDPAPLIRDAGGAPPVTLREGVGDLIAAFAAAD